ncbi:hypothetical protein C8Q74DRAFT_1370339 [Fomes fomentarius]|nr:hypothetical protein C8Q74DRAFT_1370339 [Fomes fomentarius]
MSGVAHYKVATPPSPQVIEQYAKRIANYCNIFTEDSHYAFQDPTTRDQVMATMYEGPGFESTLSPKKELSTEDRVLRAHCTFSAQFVFDEYKVRLAYLDHSDVYMRINTRADDLHFQWLDAWGPPTHGVCPKPTAASSQSVPTKVSKVSASGSESGRPPQTPSRRHSSPPRKLSPSAIEDLLRKPSDMFSSQFSYNTQEGDLAWGLVSFTQERSGIQYSIQFDDQPDRIPMDEDSMRLMLQESTLVMA